MEKLVTVTISIEKRQKERIEFLLKTDRSRFKNSDYGNNISEFFRKALDFYDRKWIEPPYLKRLYK